jgi:dihydropteroate synthase
MGILNLTPDSFYDGGAVGSAADAVSKAERMIREGADILDVGAVSTKPGAVSVSEEEEMQRLLPVLNELTKQFPESIFSVDTFRSAVALRALDAGAHMINDVFGGRYDEDIMNVAAKANAPYIIMHMQGEPSNMQQDPTYTDVVKEVLQFLAERVRLAQDHGISDVIIDPGFGFGKTVEHNFALLDELERFQMLERPLLAGLSRKSMINRTLGIKPANALNGTSVLNTVALMKGAQVLRVHDVKEAVETVMLITKLKESHT